MYHRHFKTLPSTQNYLKENLLDLKNNNPNVLISCSEQTEGIGRNGNKWNSIEHSLTISFTLKPNKNPTLTPIEIGIIVVEFFKKKFNTDLFLKWPNDILTSEGKKCGGIICNYIDSETVITGLGINFGKIKNLEEFNFKHGICSANESIALSQKDQEALSNELYLEILNNRYIDSDTIIRLFENYCYHYNKEVFIYDNGKDFIGDFKGIGDNGEALLVINNKIQSFISSSLTIL